MHAMRAQLRQRPVLSAAFVGATAVLSGTDRLRAGPDHLSESQLFNLSDAG
jgi:hypothetical protein